jgi:hypothetical protein
MSYVKATTPLIFVYVSGIIWKHILNHAIFVAGEFF